MSFTESRTAAPWLDEILIFTSIHELIARVLGNLLHNMMVNPTTVCIRKWTAYEFCILLTSLTTPFSSGPI